MTMIDVPSRRVPSSYPIRVDALGADEYAWRVTAANGRTIARSTASFATHDAARTALEDLIALAAAIELTASIGHRPGGWGWTLVDARSRPVARSPRTFERHGSCARSLHRFRTALDALAAG